MNATAIEIIHAALDCASFRVSITPRVNVKSS